MVLNSSNKKLMFTLNLSSKCSLFLLYYLEQNHIRFLEYIQGFEQQRLSPLLKNQKRLNLSDRHLDTIPIDTSLILSVFDKLSEILSDIQFNYLS